MYSGDKGTTWLPCRLVSGDTGRQKTSGRKTIKWDCFADGVTYGVVKFTVTYPKYSNTCSQYTVTGSGDTINFKMKCVEGGTFTMGCTSEQGSDCYSDENPPHSVTLSDYAMGETEITQGLWKAVMDTLPLTFSYYGTGDNYPIYDVSWYDIVGTDSGVGYTENGIVYYKNGFCYKLSCAVNNGILGNIHFRLPTEAEWEYAARGGNAAQSRTKYSGSDMIDDVAWYWDNIPSQSTDTAGYGSQPVATKQANALGIYDMSGNVAEWCSDLIGNYSSGSQTNPTGASSGSTRILRGGFWRKDMNECRVSNRDGLLSVMSHYTYGFRIAYDTK
jgi:formylglycine-generating enzyme required for sulfatase activity